MNENIEHNRRLAVLESFLSRNFVSKRKFSVVLFRRWNNTPTYTSVILDKNLQINSNHWEVSLCLYQFLLKCIETEHQIHYNYEITASSL